MEKMLQSVMKRFPLIITMGFMIVVIAVIIGAINTSNAAAYFTVDKATRETSVALASSRAGFESIVIWLPYFKFLGVAMILAGRLRQKPRDLAQAVINELDLQALRIDRADIAGPGFINFTLSRDYLREQLREVVRKGEAYGRGVWGEGLKVNLEFVSANPTGPLHVGHGRGASVGDTVARLLEFTGHDVHREFYVNDAGVQIDKLVDSIESRFRGLQGQETAIPDGGYHGDYVIELAEEVQAEFGDSLDGEWGPEERVLVREHAVRRVESEQRSTMQLLRVEFDEFRSESSLYESKQIGATLDDLAERGLIYPREGAAWLRITT